MPEIAIGFVAGGLLMFIGIVTGYALSKTKEDDGA